jgi:hypothetical protein
MLKDAPKSGRSLREEHYVGIGLEERYREEECTIVG